ncbi:MAG: hypothetical protein OIF40_13305, partial [Mangrovicoccus sp.]|nr:hypothetical protein [Mangrovicoccus sp.]
QRGKKIPAKLAALIKVDVVREVRRHELRNTLTDTLSGQYLPLSRYIQEVMRYMHYEDIPEANRVGIDPDPEARYQFLLSAYFDMVVLVEDIESKIYDLQEYVESADLLLLRKT